MGHIYKHTSPSGKGYIGQSVREPEVRWLEHVWAADRDKNDYAFHRAIRKYGPDAFTHEILHDGIDDLDELNRLEIEAIAEHGTVAPNGYNMTTGGESGPRRGTPAHAAQVVAMSSEEYRSKMSVKSKEMWSDDKIRSRLIESVKNAWTEKLRAAASEKSKEMWARTNHREKMSKLATETWQDENFRSRRLVGHRRVVTSDEYRQKMSKLVKERFKDPTAKRQLNDALRGHWASPEGRKERLKALKVKRVFVESRVFECVPDAASAYDLSLTQVRGRCDSVNFSGFRYLPRHNDPECDAVEECWAIMQWATENRDHANVPEWMRERLGLPRHGEVPSGLWAAE